MTRTTISLPDDLAEQLKRSGGSRYVRRLLRLRKERELAAERRLRDHDLAPLLKLSGNPSLRSEAEIVTAIHQTYRADGMELLDLVTLFEAKRLTS